MGTTVRLPQSPQLWEPVVEEVAGVLGAGGVAVFPTDTVYGIAQAVSANPAGPERVFSIKRRPTGKVVPWLVARMEDLDRYAADVPAYARRLAEALWPGGLTLVVSASPEVPAAYRASDGTVALRMPDCPFALAVLRAAGCALATTSANTSGLPAPVSYGQVEARIVAEADVAVDGGETRCALASTVVSCVGARPRIERLGALSAERVYSFL